MTRPTRIHHFRAGGWKNGVAIGLTHSRTTREVYWDRVGNSYVAVHSEDGQWLVDQKRVSICSIHGNGEVRWVVLPDGGCDRDKAAARHFDAVTPQDSPYTEVNV